MRLAVLIRVPSIRWGAILRETGLYRVCSHGTLTPLQPGCSPPHSPS